MRSRNQGAIPSDLGDLIDDLNDIFGRLRTLEAPSGEALGSTVAKLSALVGNIQATLTDFIDNDVTAIVDARVAIAIASYMSGNVAVGGSLTVNNDIIAPAVRALDLSAAPGRVSTWQAGDGRLGHT